MGMNRVDTGTGAQGSKNAIMSKSEWLPGDKVHRTEPLKIGEMQH